MKKRMAQTFCLCAVGNRCGEVGGRLWGLRSRRKRDGTGCSTKIWESDRRTESSAPLPEPDEIKSVEIPLPEARTTKINAEQMDVASQIRSAYAEQASQKEGRAKKTEEEILATNEKIRKAVEDLNKKMVSNTEAVFGIHDGTNRVTIKMVDKTSKKVIREYPPEETREMLAKIWVLAGMMIDEKG